MLRGIVNQDDEPIVNITLIFKNRRHKLPAVIDTGFNGYLSVPQHIANKSKWYFAGFEEYEIATGELVTQRVYLGDVIFDKFRQTTYIVTSNSKDILIGTKLLRNKLLRINFKSKYLTIR